MTFHLAIGTLCSLSLSTRPLPSQVYEPTRANLGVLTQSLHSHSPDPANPMTPISLLVCLSTGKGSPSPYRSLGLLFTPGQGIPFSHSVPRFTPSPWMPQPKLLAHQDYYPGRLNSHTITSATRPLAKVTYQWYHTVTIGYIEPASARHWSSA